VDSEVMTVKEAARFLKISTHTLYRRMKEGLPYFQLRKYASVRFIRTELIQFLEDNNSVSRWLDPCWRRFLQKHFDRWSIDDVSNLPRWIPRWRGRL
jgi:excisionase family DNA binding protein